MTCLTENRIELSILSIITMGLSIIFLSIVLFGCKAQSNEVLIQQNLANLNSNLLGTWINEEDPNWKIEFDSNGNCYWHYTNEETETFSFSILTTSPQCGQEVKTGGLEDFYLKLTGQGFNDEYCYEILGVNNESLSIRTIGLGVKNYYFNKQ